MPVAWFLCPYAIRLGRPNFRYCQMDDFTAMIRADGGDWHETEVLGNRAIVKVRASLATLQAITGTAGFRRLPKDRLDESLSDLSPAVRRGIRDELETMGYPLAEIQAQLGNNLDAVTLGTVLRFATTRRRKPRWDVITQSIVLDGPVQACRSVESVDRAV